MKIWILFCIGFFLLSCGPSSPRFAGSEKKQTKKEEEHKKGNIRFSSKEAEEEKREDDKKIDVKKVHERFSAEKEKPIAKNESVHSPDVKNVPPAPSSTPQTFEQQKMMDAILAWMGTPYEYGKAAKSGTDCSGFTMQIFTESAGMKLPRTTDDQMKLGTSVSQDNLKFGDLIFFNTNGHNPSHVGIYIGDDMFAHSSVSFGVTLSSMYSSYYKKRYTGARRVLQ